MKALVIGVDAGCRPVFDDLRETDSIPNISALAAEGLSTELESQIPPWTPSAWPSIYTGANPGKHGVYGFVTFDGYDWEVSTADHVRERTLWELLDDHGRSSVVVNAPVTYPPADVDGAIVPGFMAPEEPQCHPEGLFEELVDEIGEYRVYPRYSRDDERRSDEEKIDEYRRLARMRGDAFRYLADRFEPDLGFVQFQKTDTVFHEFEGDPEHVRRIYEETDEQIGAILDACDPDYVFLVSDHGIGQYENFEFRVNEFLRDRGFLNVSEGGKGMPSWNPIRNQLRDGDADRTWDLGLAGRLARGASRVGVDPRSLLDRLEHVGMADAVRRYVPDGVVRATSEQVDFEASTAYMRARTELGVRINLEGREPDGVVAREEYESVRTELMDQLTDVQTPDGKPVFEEVAPRERYFSGPFAEDAVDIVTVPRDFSEFLSAQLLGDQFGPPTEPWNHKLEGVLIAAGDGVAPDAAVNNAHIFDVAPTVMAAMDVPYSDRMDGTVLPVVSDTGTAPYPAADGTTLP